MLTAISHVNTTEKLKFSCACGGVIFGCRGWRAAGLWRLTFNGVVTALENRGG